MKIQKIDKLVTAKIADAVFTKDGLIPAVVQDVSTREVLMVAYMNLATLAQTIETGTMTYWSRSRKRVWIKGQTSGQFQRVRSMRLDCDGDTLLFEVEQEGSGACHTGARTCFHRKLEA